MSDLFLVAMCAVVCVEHACVLIIINTTLASCGADCHRHCECEVTQKPDWLIDSPWFGVRTTKSKVRQQWNDGYDIDMQILTFLTVSYVSKNKRDLNGI